MSDPSELRSPSLPVRIDSNNAENTHIAICQGIPRRSPRHHRTRARRLEAVYKFARFGVANLQPGTY